MCMKLGWQRLYREPFLRLDSKVVIHLALTTALGGSMELLSPFRPYNLPQNVVDSASWCHVAGDMGVE